MTAPVIINDAEPRTVARADESSDVDEEERVVIRRLSRDDLLTWLGAGISAFALTWLVYGRLTLFSGSFGFVVVWFVAFVVISWILAYEQWGSVGAMDHLTHVLIVAAASIALVPLGAVLGAILVKGYRALNLNFLFQDMSSAGPADAFDAGGVWHSLVGSLEMVGLALVISVPLGVATAVFLNEIGGRLARLVRMLTDAMSAVPSIVAGLFIYAVLIQSHRLEQSGFAAALALSVLMLPTVTRTTEVVLRLVPGGLREASLALGATEWRTTTGVVIPTARTGIATAVILGVARIIGETAPLILTALGNRLWNPDPFSGKQDALPLFVFTQFKLSQGPGSASELRAWSGAFVLMALVLALFATARIIGGTGNKAPRRSRRGE